MVPHLSPNPRNGIAQDQAGSRPTQTLFICNFDPRSTRYEDLERHFEGFGQIRRVHIVRNFALMEFDKVEAAAAAQEARTGSRLGRSVITVQFNVEEAGGLWCVGPTATRKN